MASYSQRGDQILAQVRIKRAGAYLINESKLFPTRGEAETWAQALEKQVKKDGPAAVAIRNKTLGSLILGHLEHLKKIRGDLGIGRSSTQNHEYMAHEFRDLKLSAMTAKHFTDFALRRKLKDEAQPPTILANLSVVSAAIGAAPHAQGIKGIDSTELEIAIKGLHQDGVIAKAKEIDRLVFQEEEDALLAEFRRRNLMPQTVIDMELMYHWALALPRRPSELCRMMWKDIDPVARTITIRDVKHPRKKKGNDQTIPLLSAAWELLERTPKVDGRILPYESESVSSAFENVRNRIAECQLPKIKDLRFYDLRHTGITMLFWDGHPIQEVAVVSGHTNWTALQRYTHIKPEDLHRRHDPKFGGKKRLSSVETLKTDARRRRAKTAG